MKYSILLLTLLLSLKGFGQLQGIVLDKETSLPVAYTNIWIENEDVGTTSDIDGTFELKEKCNGKTLVISAVGYEALRVSIDSSYFEIHLIPKVYHIAEVKIAPIKKKELVITKYKKSNIDNYCGGVSPQIYARFFPYIKGYEHTPFIKSIKMETYSKIKSCFKLRFMTIDENGEPGVDIVKDNIIIQVKKGRKTLLIDNFNSKLIQIPEEGLFIAVEFLIIKENEFQLQAYNYDTEKKEKVTCYMPLIGGQKNEDTENGWVYSNGKWSKNDYGQLFNNRSKKKNNYSIAMEVILSN